MRRWIIPAVIALAAMPLVADALTATAVVAWHPSGGAWVDALIALVRAGLALTVAVAVLRFCERPPRPSRLWLADWRVLGPLSRVVIAPRERR